MGDYCTSLGTSWVKSYFQNQNTPILEPWQYKRVVWVLALLHQLQNYHLPPQECHDYCSHAYRSFSDRGCLTAPQASQPTEEVASFPQEVVGLRVRGLGGADDRHCSAGARGENGENGEGKGREHFKERRASVVKCHRRQGRSKKQLLNVSTRRLWEIFERSFSRDVGSKTRESWAGGRIHWILISLWIGLRVTGSPPN